LVQKHRNATGGKENAQAQYKTQVDAWRGRIFGDGTERPDSAAVDAPDPNSWREVTLPNAFEKIGYDMDGLVWVRRTVDVPAAMAGKDLTLELGPVDDFDATYVNGERVGTTGPETPSPHAYPRRYTVPGRLVRAGANVIAIRVLDTGGGGGPYGQAEQMRIGDGTTWVSLAGPWQLRVERDFKQTGDLAQFTPPEAPIDVNNSWLPTGLYNGMVAPVAPYSVKGAIWYQGESNVGRAKEYSVLFPAMIQSWRRAWDNPAMAFYFVQLASYGPVGDSTTESGWADLREAQTAALRLPGVGMAVAIDAGESGDIHPIRKDLVADRLALNALARNYGRRVEFEGPSPRQARVDGNALRIKMTHGRGLKTLDGAPVRGFALAGPDGKWYVAEARLQGDEVVLTSPQVKNPVSARYAWADYIAANLANANNLPAAPFRLTVK
jgi:sialate O-acetylesterase